MDKRIVDFIILVIGVIVGMWLYEWAKAQFK
jgi:hypothetical protein